MLCEICGVTFLNSDEFNAHTQKHMLEDMREYIPLLRAVSQRGAEQMSVGVGALAESIAQRTAELVLAKMPSPALNSVQMALPPQPHFSFEVLQLAIACLTSKRSTEEVIELCRQLTLAMEKREG